MTNIDLGTLQATLAIKGAEEFKREMEEAGETAEKSQEEISKGEQNLGQSFQDAGKEAQKSGQEIKTSFINVKSIVNVAKTAVKGLTTVLKTVGNIAKKSIQVAIKALQKLGNLAVQVGKKLKTGLENAFKTLVKSITAFSASLSALTVGFVKLVNDTADWGDEIDKQSQKVGFSAEAYQVWDQVLQHCGADVSALGPAMKTLTKAVASDSEDIANAFSAIGLSQQQLMGMSAEEQFDAVIRGLQGIGDEGERTRLAMELLGKSGQELGPLLNTTAEETQKLKDDVYALGGVMSDEAVKASADYKDSLQNLKTVIGGIKNSIIGDFLPSMTLITKGLTEMFGGNSMIGSLVISAGLNDLIQEMKAKLPEIERGLQEFWWNISFVIDDNLENITKFGAKVIDDFLKGIREITPSLMRWASESANSFIENFPSYFDTLGDICREIIYGLVDIIDTTGPKIIEALAEIFEPDNENVIGLVKSIDELNVKVETMLLNKDFIKAIEDKGDDIVKGIGQVCDRITNPDIWEEVFDYLGNLGGAIAGSFDDIDWDGVSQRLYELIKLGVEKVGPMLLDGLDWAGTIVGDILDGFDRKLHEEGIDTSKLTDGFIKIVGDGLRIIKIGADIILEVVGSIVGDLADKFSNPKDTTLTEFSQGLTDFIMKAIKKIPDLMTDLATALPPILNAIGDAIKNLDHQAVAEAIASVINMAIEVVPSLLKNVAEIGANLITDILEGMNEALFGTTSFEFAEALDQEATSLEDLQKKFKSLHDYYLAHPDIIPRELWQEQLAEMQEEAKALGYTMDETGRIFTNTGELMGDCVDSMSGGGAVFGQVSEQIQTGFIDKMEEGSTASEDFQKSLEAIGDIDLNTAVDQMTLLEEIIDKTGDDPAVLTQRAKEMMAGFSVGLGTGLTNTIKVLSQLGTKCKVAVGDQTKTLIEKGKDTLEGFITGYKEKEPTVMKFFQDLDGNIKNWVGDVSQLLFQKGQDILGSLYDGAKSAFDEDCEPFFVSVGDAVLDAIGDLSDLLYNSGYQMMQGMARGISDGSSSVINNAVSVAQSAVQQTESTLGINSPSRVFAEIGGFIDEGLARGIADRAKVVFGQVMSLADGVVEYFNPQPQPQFALPTGTMPTTQTQQTVYNIYIDGAKVNDDAQIENQFQELFLDMARKGMM